MAGNCREALVFPPTGPAKQAMSWFLAQWFELVHEILAHVDILDVSTNHAFTGVPVTLDTGICREFDAFHVPCLTCSTRWRWVRSSSS